MYLSYKSRYTISTISIYTIYAIASLEQELVTKEERIADLEAEARTTQQEPAVFQCGFQDEFATGNAVIRFDRLTLDEQTGAGGLDTLEISKLSTISTLSTGLDINTGVFTADYSGVWAVSYSARFIVEDYANHAYIYINSQQADN